MNIRTILRGLSFEWDEAKARTNLRKHGVSFESACEVFLDPLVVVKEAGDRNRETQVVIGEAEDERLLVVVHMVRSDEIIRIVSARPVTKQERREYEG
jgi:uncharacterized DUF497 family protein